MRPVIVIEHLEPFTSKWMFLEIKHSAEVAKPYDIWLTNVKRECEREILSKYVDRVLYESIVEIAEKEGFEKIVVLDPSAKVVLRHEDIKGTDAVVVGGIMGSHPPEGRTKSLLSKRLAGSIIRSIGDGQFTINGAVYMVRKVLDGFKLEDVRTIKGVKLVFRGGEVFLPYVYPIEGGKVVIPQEEVDYILSQLPEDEERYIKYGERPAIC